MGAWEPATRKVGRRRNCVQDCERAPKGSCAGGEPAAGAWCTPVVWKWPRPGPDPSWSAGCAGRAAAMGLRSWMSSLGWEPRGASGPLARSSRPSNLNHAGSQPGAQHQAARLGSERLAPGSGSWGRGARVPLRPPPRGAAGAD